MWTSFAIGANTMHLDRILEMIDYMYSDEATTLFQWGQEGIHYIIENNISYKKLLSDKLAFFSSKNIF